MLIEILSMMSVEILGILEENKDLWGQVTLGVPILGGDERLPEFIGKTRFFVVGLGGTKDNKPRQRLFEVALAVGFEPLTLIHPTAIISKAAVIGTGCQLLPGSIVNIGAELGQNVIINSGAIVEHDCSIEDHVHIATGARLASTITIGKGSHIGAGATIRQGIRIGSYALIAAGAVVVNDVPDKTAVAGVPAKPFVLHG